MDLSYIHQSVQGPALAFVAAVGIGLVAIVIACIFWNEKKFQAGNEEEH